MEFDEVGKAFENLTINETPQKEIATDRVDGFQSSAVRVQKQANKRRKNSFPLETSNEDLRPIFETINTADKGYGLFATRKIPSGTLIMSEKALIHLSKHEEDDSDAIEQKYSNLSKKEQKTYRQLFDAQQSRTSSIVSIYYSNCYNCDDFVDEEHKDGGSAIGAHASRINHSCVPNVQFSYDNSRQIMSFYAIKPISRGKELFSNYHKTVFEVSSRRKQKLLLLYGFTCTCEACDPQTDFWRRSDERRRDMIVVRKQLREMETRWETCREYDRSGGGGPMQVLSRLEGLMIKEGLVGGNTLAKVYRSMAKWALRINDDMQEFKKWKIKELEIFIISYGEQSKQVCDLRDTLSSYKLPQNYKNSKDIPLFVH